MSLTIQESIKQLHSSLSDYIEATYHISSAALIEQRKRLLNTLGVIHQEPFLESTPRYQLGQKFSQIEGLPKAASQAFAQLTAKKGDLPRVIFDPPYSHQAKSLKCTLVDGKNIVIMTGTGSGKTESFLLPILGKLAVEAQANPHTFDTSAIRALILYPMNALVNDQLGRLRAMFGDPRISKAFKGWAGRPPRFARYTSRTPYAGIRDRKKDGTKLKPFEKFYVDIQRQANGEPSEYQALAQRLLDQLHERGKWPSKPDLVAWYGEKSALWQDRNTKEFKRAVTLADDTELLTRHEVQANPPDLLVTNYSMLEYMLMRPIERTIFDKTKDWLEKNPEQKFLIVLDEAHLYRGAAGAEVGLLLRRLRDRLGIPDSRLQVICATASFEDETYAPHFGAQLSGVDASTFEAVTGSLALRSPAAPGSDSDVGLLCQIDMDAFFEATSDEDRRPFIGAFLKARNSGGAVSLERSLYDALEQFPPLGLLVNLTMKKAQPISDLIGQIFPGVEAKNAGHAITTLMALASMAKPEPNAPGLLPCRVHNFFRGLPGIWACMDPNCTELQEGERSGICGKLYGQPVQECACGARVLELYTCRFCGTAYGRAYTDNVDSPQSLWSEPGQRMRIESEETEALLPLDLLLERAPLPSVVEKADFDLETGQLNHAKQGRRVRAVYLRKDRLLPSSDEDEDYRDDEDTRGQFIPCACCGRRARFGSYVQDHQTKGDQPFEALVSKQIQIQPPNAVQATRFAPLRGRKVLVFSDSRQVAARLAPNLQMYSVRDSLRPLIVSGFARLQTVNELKSVLSLEDLYLSVLLAAKKLGVRLRPELKIDESFAAEEVVEAAVSDGSADTNSGLLMLGMKMRNEYLPASLLEDIVNTINHPFWGLEALALAAIAERRDKIPEIFKLPTVPSIATSEAQKIGLTRAWLRCWRPNGFWLRSMPQTWWQRPRAEGFSVRGKKGKGTFDAMKHVFGDNRAAKKIFNDSWSPALLRLFTEDVSGIRRLRGSDLSLTFENNWVRCATCKSVHQPIDGLLSCLDCGNQMTAPLDPSADPVFLARKGYYRSPVLAALRDPPIAPIALIAAEHTAQLNAPQSEDIFSKAEENELLFQDVELFWDDKNPTAIDVLSSTTTMEVGIDIGALSGVALRNMPPSRANYQQRAGRAGRRGNAVATVVAFGSADSHDEHYFSKPAGMISGPVVDPRLTLDNPHIAKRHTRAFLLQRYHQDRLPTIDPQQRHDLFSVLGSVKSFKSAGSQLNRQDFASWLNANSDELRSHLSSWLPAQLSAADRTELLMNFATDALREIDKAIGSIKELPDASPDAIASDDEEETIEAQPEEGEERPAHRIDADNLLDRLLYHGVLPRYAFPTDVATFHVFDVGKTTHFRPVMKFAPSQGLPVALSQYAPGKQIWISNKCYTSGAIYSLVATDRFNDWDGRRLYLECSVCGFARTVPFGSVDRNSVHACEACGAAKTFGPARVWLRPTGFAHPFDLPEVTSPDEIPETSYATRAKLVMPSPSEPEKWRQVNPRLRVLKTRDHLLVSNTGPKQEGYTYCVKCGRIEASNTRSPILIGDHRKPFLDEKEQLCMGVAPSRHIVLGTDFVTDIALFSMKVSAPFRLTAGDTSTVIALRTVSEALARAACRMLEIEPGELLAEFRPAVTEDGKNGLEAEIFIYDVLSGGAGFSSQLVEHSEELFQLALGLVKNCPEGCDASCYRCLRSFKNKFEHSLLDRHVGAELLEYLMDGKVPGFDAKRVERSTNRLFSDLLRQDTDVAKFELNQELRTPSGEKVYAPISAKTGDGKHYVVALSGPLTPEHPARPGDVALKKLKDVELVFVNETLVRGNLPAATRLVEEKVS